MRLQTTVLAAFSIALVATLVHDAPVQAQAGSRIERRLALASGGRFTLTTDVGGVTVVGDSNSGVAVTVTSDREDLNDKLDFKFEEEAGAARITAVRRGRVSRLWSGDWFRGNVRFDIHVPKQTAIDIHTAGGGIDASGLAAAVRVDTSGGGIRVADIDGDVNGHTSGGGITMRMVRGAVVADTSGGGIDISDVRSSLRAHTSGGSIRLATVGGAIVAETSGGGIDVRGARDRVDAHTSGGSVSVGFTPGNNRGGDISTSGGGVSAEIDPGVALSIDASSSGGGVSSDVAVTVRGSLNRRELRGEMNGGGALLRLQSSGGSVRIRSVSRTSASR